MLRLLTLVWLNLALFGNQNYDNTLHVCHVNTAIGNILPRANDAPMEFSGFHLAVEQLNKANPSLYLNLHIVRPKSSREDIISIVKRGVGLGCEIFVGLVTSRDALLAGQFLKENDLLGISSTVVADDIQKFYPHLISLSPSSSMWTQSVVQFLRSHGEKLFYLIKKPSDIFSTLLSESLLKKMGPDRVEVLSMNENNLVKIPEKITSQMVFVFSTYPFVSLPTLKNIVQKSSAPHKQIILGNPAWMETHIFHELTLKDRMPLVYIPTTMESKGRDIYKQFEREYEISFKTAPDHDSCFDYDAVTLIAHCFKRSKRGKRAAQVKECLRSPLRFVGVTGTFNLDGRSAHVLRKVKLVKLKL